MSDSPPPASGSGSSAAPSAGARYLLVRRSQEAQGGQACARYDATVTTAEAIYRAELLLREDGSFEMTPVLDAAADAPALPEPLAKALGMFAKLTARGAPSRRTEGVPLWPARVTRWRP